MRILGFVAPVGKVVTVVVARLSFVVFFLYSGSVLFCDSDFLGLPPAAQHSAT